MNAPSRIPVRPGKVWFRNTQRGSVSSNNPPCNPPKSGKVWLVGAGPGDVELLTLKAVRALGEADVALVDDLVNREVKLYADIEAALVASGAK